MRGPAGLERGGDEELRPVEQGFGNVLKVAERERVTQ